MVTITAWIGGMLSILGGLFVLWVAALPTDELLRDDILGLGVFEIGLGLTLVLAASGLPGRHRAARIVVTVVSGIMIAHTVIAALLGLPLGWVPTALCAVVIVLLWAGPARRHFRRPEPADGR
ncbi:MAG TPA: hypothetical protein VNJ54_18275 [Plantibacter sp.]|uniref:hypothetical protein n=1 Tax=unclassified Plantibacter TaxID=2624265 RepID=UPI002C841705|nr:hypothetical protein [Plantibacter sp.]